LFALLSVGLIAFLSLLFLRNIAPKDAPWAPLSLEDPIGFATKLKLAALRNDLTKCPVILGTAQQLRFRAAASDSGTKNCPLSGTVVIERTMVTYGQEMASTCALAASIYIWEREVVQPAALKHLGAGVARIDTYGTFACRNVYNRENDSRSEHASANALDVAGFRLTDGRRITLVRDWRAKGDSAEFLRAVRDGSCKLFNGVLGPEYNAAHEDHFHLDMGPYRVCQ